MELLPIVTQRILLISPTPTHPQDAGNRARIFHLAQQLRSLNCDLYFAYYDIEGGDLDAMRTYWGDRMYLLPCRKAHDLDDDLTCTGSVSSGGLKAGANLATVDRWYDSSIEEEVRRLHRLLRFSTIWVEYVYLSKVLEVFDDTVTKVIDTHDVFANRKEMLINGGITPQWFYTNCESEKLGLSRAQIVIAIKEEEAEYFKGLGLPAVITIGHLLPDQHCSPGFDKENDSVDLLYVASHNPINVKSWDYFTEKILFLIKAKFPDISINVAGKICGSIPDSKYYRKLGIVDDLQSLYRSARIVINPVVCGTGLKIKTVEPLAFGCPVVTTSIGIGGIEGAKGLGVLVGRTPKEFVGHIEMLLMSRSYYRKQSQYAREYHKKYLGRNRRNLKWLLSYCDNQRQSS